MFHQFKITTYAIIVALAAVLVLPVNAAELQFVIHTEHQVAQFIDPRNQSKRGVKPLSKPTLKQAPKQLLLELDAADCKRELEKLLLSLIDGLAEFNRMNNEIRHEASNLQAALDDYWSQRNENIEILRRAAGVRRESRQGEYIQIRHLFTQNMQGADNAHQRVIQNIGNLGNTKNNLLDEIAEFKSRGECGMQFDEEGRLRP